MTLSKYFYVHYTEQFVLLLSKTTAYNSYLVYDRKD